MTASTRTLPDRCRQHVDKINQALAAGDFGQAFYLAYQYFRGEVSKCHDRRPLDADGFRRHAACILAGVANEIHRRHPDDEFRFSVPLVPGGDWEPGS